MPYSEFSSCYLIIGGPNLCDHCDPNTPSCGANLVCSDATYRCECPVDQVQIADICCRLNTTKIIPFFFNFQKENYKKNKVLQNFFTIFLATIL
jgi:hypothetical protein